MGPSGAYGGGIPDWRRDLATPKIQKSVLRLLNSMSTLQPSHDAVYRLGLCRLPSRPGIGEERPLSAGAPLWTESATLAQPAGAAITSTGVAVVVCTQQRADSLRRFLDSLATQDRRPDELI